MFDIGGPELLLILVIALVVLGPRRLPAVGRQIGRALATVRRASREMRTNLEREVALEEVRNGARTVKDTVERELRDVGQEASSTEPVAAPGESERAPVEPGKSAGDAAKEKAPDTPGPERPRR
jgi:sec-independent protein translocase protein TatB